MPDASSNNGDARSPPEPVLEFGEQRIQIVSTFGYGVLHVPRYLRRDLKPGHRNYLFAIFLGPVRLHVAVACFRSGVYQNSAWGVMLMVMIMQLPGASDTAASFEFEGEDHTLGNALRYIIMKK